MTDAKTTTLTKSFVLPVAPAEAWDWLTKADKLAQWFNPHEGDLAPGSGYAHLNDAGERICWGEVLTWEPPRTLKQTFTVRPLDGVMTEVEWHLTGLPGGTLVTLTHSGVPTGSATDLGVVAHLDSGWDRHIASLRSTVQG